jgi:hypothetical protein
MEEHGYGPHGGNVECQFENMECDQTRQDGMGDGPCKGGNTRIFQVYLIWVKPTVHYTQGQDVQNYQPHWFWWTFVLPMVVPINFWMNFCLPYISSFSMLTIVCHPQCTMQRASLRSWAWNAISSMHAKWGAYCIGVFMRIFKNAQNAVPLDTNK